MYDQREKAQRDYEWAITGALQQGREQGRQEGRQEGLEEGRREGRQEGEQFGVLKGKIQLLEQLLGNTPTTEEQFENRDLGTLMMQLAALQQRLRDRQ